MLLQPHAAGPATRPTAAGLPIAGRNKLSSCRPPVRAHAAPPFVPPAAANACPLAGAEELSSYRRIVHHMRRHGLFLLRLHAMPGLIPLLLRPLPASQNQPASHRSCYFDPCGVDHVLAVPVVFDVMRRAHPLCPGMDQASETVPTSTHARHLQ